jgi:hypothetical protein
MPSRPIACLIFLFWAATSGWFVYAEVWPQIGAGQPQPFAISLSDEARKNVPAVRWDIFRNHKRVGKAETQLKYLPEVDLFLLSSNITSLNLGAEGIIQNGTVDSKYRVTREGGLRSVDITVSLHLLLGMSVTARLNGNVANQVFKSRLEIDSPFKRTFDLPAVEVANQGSILNPLHPVSRVTGLAPGKTWRLPLVDPVRDALASVIPGGAKGVSYVQAHVLPEIQLLHWEGEPRPCYVIEYEGEGVAARTWVMVSDGTVLRQEARMHDEHLIMERTSPL